MLSYGSQWIQEDDVQAVVETLRGNWLTQGPKVEEFESSLAAKVNANYAIAVANGTAALHLTAIALGWGKDDIVITTPLTFLATANSIVYTGAIPEFVDINEETYTIDVNKLEDKLKMHRKQGDNVKAVIGVDYAGHPCDWQALRNLADKYKIQLVDDACHAIGSEIDGDIGYASKYADAVIYSFHPVKHITSGEGGAVVTNNEQIGDKVRTMRTHGITKDPKKLSRNDGPWYYEMRELGYNYRITDMQCALGISQLKKLDKFISKRRELANNYHKHFVDSGMLTIPIEKPGIRHAYHLYPLQIPFDRLRMDKIQFFRRLKKNGISGQVHYIPVHTQPFYRNQYGFQYGDFPKAEAFYSREISLPLYPKLTTEEQQFVLEQVISLLD